MSITLIIVVVTTGVSLWAFSNESILQRTMFNPYVIKVRNEWFRTISHAFVHANFPHLLINMYVLYTFGSTVEQIFTNQRYFNALFPGTEFWGASTGLFNYAVLYIGGILFAVIPAFRKHSNNPNYNSLGASGAVSAVVMALIVLLPTTTLSIIFLPIQFPAFVGGLAYLGYEYYMNKRGGSGIAHDAHLWGALFGIVYMLTLELDFALHFYQEIAYWFNQTFS